MLLLLPYVDFTFVLSTTVDKNPLKFDSNINSFEVVYKLKLLIR